MRRGLSQQDIVAGRIFMYEQRPHEINYLDPKTGYVVITEIKQEY